MYACFTLSYVFTHADQVHLELLEVLELYCETLHARFALLELKKYVAFDFFFFVFMRIHLLCLPRQY